VIAALAKDANFELERIPNGTNIFRMRVNSVNAPVFRGRLDAAGISTGTPVGEWFVMQVNETWARVPAGEIIGRFHRALG
jgi:hypothetical protein